MVERYAHVIDARKRKVINEMPTFKKRPIKMPKNNLEGVKMQSYQ